MSSPLKTIDDCGIIKALAEANNWRKFKMMKYKGYYWTILTPMIRRSIQKRCGEALAASSIRNGRQHFKDLLSRADDLGPGNPMECNAYFAYVFVAVWLGSEKKIPPETMGKIMEDVIVKMKPFFGLINLNTKKGSRYWYHSMKKYEKWYAQHGKDYPAAWKVHFDENLHKDGSFYYFTSCPVCAFMQKEGLGEIMGTLCGTDWLMFKMQHGVLHRACTLADGQPMCDYWVVGDQTENPE